ncbi:MAG TPA: hypothetical protein VGB54_14810 [Allosphingosinicella sp.]
MRHRWIVNICIAAALAGCAGAPEGYPISVEEAYRRLANSELPELRLRRQCGILIHIRPEGDGSRAVTWRVFSSGREMVSFTATLTPVDAAHTRAEISVSREDDGKEAYDGTEHYPRPAFNQPLRPAVEEQIAALLEGRPYDLDRVPRGQDEVCGIQRAGLEHGHRFGVNDMPGLDSQGSASARRSAGWGAGRGGGWGR